MSEGYNGKIDEYKLKNEENIEWIQNKLLKFLEMSQKLSPCHTDFSDAYKYILTQISALCWLQTYKIFLGRIDVNLFHMYYDHTLPDPINE